jgi:cation diffusion facilitator family transporter
LSENSRSVSNVLIIALALNILVAFGKTLYGSVTGTLSMIADGLHSFADAASSVMGLVAVRYATRPSDSDHHYGHYKFETLAALGVGAFIGLTSWEILKNASERLIHPEHTDFYFSGLWIMAITMLINGGLSWYERKKSVEFKSAILKADAYHTASDLMVSFSVFLSLIAIKYGLTWVDPIVSLFLVLYFLRVAYKLIKENVLDLSDAAFIDTLLIKSIAKSVPGVIGCHRVRTRGRFGNVFIDLHIQVDPELPTLQSHQLAHAIETKIRGEIQGVRDVLIHTEPYPDPDEE